jgi:ABC-type taurine transport system ATPase subunit
LSAVAPSRPEPVLVADDVRVDVDGVPACDGLTFRTQGEHVLVLGAPRALFEAVTGLVPVVRGGLSIRGTAAGQAAKRGVIAGAAMDPPTPPRWTVNEYVLWSGRLAGVPAAALHSSAEAAIEKMQLAALAKTEMARLVPHARRATTVAGALATCAEVIALDDPLGGLPDDVASMYATVLADALRDRAWVVFAGRMPLASPLATLADEAIIATAARVDAQGPPAELAAAERRFVARFEGSIDLISPVLAANGARVELRGAHAIVDLGASLGTSELLAICDKAGVAVLELVPASRALS